MSLNRALAACALLFLPAIAAAQAAPAAKPAPAPISAPAEGAEPPGYREAIQEAIAEYDAGRYAEARALFNRAHGLMPSARTLRGLGMAEFELRNYATSARMLEDALASPVRKLEGELRTHSESLLARARGFLGRFTVRLTPAETQLLIDGAPAVIERDGTLALGVGNHTLQARAEGHAPISQAITVNGGEQTTLNVTLQKQAALAPAPVVAIKPAQAAPTQPAPAQASDSDDSSIFASPWLWAAVGVVVVGAGVGVGVVLLSGDAAQADPYGGDTDVVLSGP